MQGYDFIGVCIYDFICGINVFVNCFKCSAYIYIYIYLRKSFHTYKLQLITRMIKN